MYWSAETGRYLGRTAFADSSGIAGAGARTFWASNGAGAIVEAGVDEERAQVQMPGVAFDNHLRFSTR